MHIIVSDEIVTRLRKKEGESDGHPLFRSRGRRGTGLRYKEGKWTRKDSVFFSTEAGGDGGEDKCYIMRLINL